MPLQMSLACERLDTKGALECSGLVGVMFGPLFSARHHPLLVGVPLDVVFQALRVTENILAGGAVEEGKCLVFG